ncbi:hypothetical protein [Streptomyces sp. NPDC058268]
MAATRRAVPVVIPARHTGHSLRPVLDALAVQDTLCRTPEALWK